MEYIFVYGEIYYENLKLNPPGHAQLSRKIFKKTKQNKKLGKKEWRFFYFLEFKLHFLYIFAIPGNSWRIFRREEGEWGRSKQELQTEKKKADW